MNQDIWIIEGLAIDSRGEWEIARGAGYFTNPDEAAAAAEEALVQEIRLCVRLGQEIIILGDDTGISGIDQAHKIARMGAAVVHLRPAGSPPPEPPRHIGVPGGPEAAVAAAVEYMSDHAGPAEPIVRTRVAEVPAAVIDPLELDAAVAVLGAAVEEAHRKARIVLHHLGGDGGTLTTASSMSVPELLTEARRNVERVAQGLADAHSSVFGAARYVKKLESGDRH
ncbi:Uncharacterised protein (plasmid) [Tsukamurella tyrosinosolvens]|uniref:Uncharacterized protein n=1 Tax=Tsukamurella tyrosinosolvens TaxID=57704 RepID=A0A1H4I603_TSUTY|nr:hypothetical protein [Tsukamurella tyrosinosolvens]KXO92759.1 hypothetical protein AXK58_19375 [Tsukamurella tyrosinosolvens]SEB29507.1 hypothetical protein SAMN04489793_0027 [Tsukamurella tyrosinosolvens]VEH95902.1 Uncharacterised protein [Tsukamurella tyrosinosolvens]